MHWRYVMHVISVSEKILPAKTCSCSFYPVSYTPWVYSNTNRNQLSVNTLKDTPVSPHTVTVKAVFNALALCTLFLSLNKYFRQRLVLVLSTLYHTHPGCSQTPVEINFQSTLWNIHPCNSIHSVSVQAVF